MTKPNKIRLKVAIDMIEVLTKQDVIEIGYEDGSYNKFNYTTLQDGKRRFVDFSKVKVD
jgi:hypothetical protein